MAFGLFKFPTHSSAHASVHTRITLSSWNSPSQQPFDKNDDAASSVGDYVQGVHGGKYQFEEVGGATFAGRQFAESLYSSSNDDGTVYDNDNDEEDIPAWAERMGSSAKLGTLAPLQRYPILNVPTTISISNEERSWEHYYCKLVQVSPDGTVLDETAVWCHQQQQQSAALVVSPATGHLAPRGGSSNLCDPSKPYSDTATLQMIPGSDGKDALPANHHYLLVVGTEAEVWPYWISFPDE